VSSGAHRKFGVRERHYEVVRRGEPLIATLQRFAAPSWNETAKHAWETAFNHAAGIMIDAAKDDAAESPAWWIATVTAIERRGPDIAVLTLQPEQPLAYLPGQHVSVQTPHWPRLWRTYSVANAPRPDGRHREIVLYYGARRHQDLYDLRSLQEMERPTRGSRSSRRFLTSPPMTRMSCTAPSPS